MATPVRFKGANSILIGKDDTVANLPVHKNGICVTSKWELSPEEIIEITDKKCIWVTLFSGNSQPPMFIGNEKETKSVVIDYGKTW